jgi:hypothetical protein
MSCRTLSKTHVDCIYRTCADCAYTTQNQAKLAVTGTKDTPRRSLTMSEDSPTCLSQSAQPSFASAVLSQAQQQSLRIAAKPKLWKASLCHEQASFVPSPYLVDNVTT